ncbi:glycerophosphodiester phosphodiesterase [Streptomyces sodiiphilus]|uniref:Glycerophosphodiester phosphodiesterase n=1 Tax=Streptomyces sodiiphilus TaxID=226217 RepID=A0ABP5A2R9_9ACTN
MAIAHRGDPHRGREDALVSFRSAIEAGADVVKLDVRATRDELPVVVHDRTLRRRWGPNLRVEDLTIQELRALTGPHLPLLREALAVTYPVRTLIGLPEPSAAAARAAAEVVQENGATKRVTYCGDPAALRAVRAADRDAEIALTWQRTAQPRLSLLRDLRPHWLNIRFGLLSRETVRSAHAEGYRVAAWTADSPPTMRRLVGMGVDAISTHHIGALRRVLGRQDPGPATG